MYQERRAELEERRERASSLEIDYGEQLNHLVSLHTLSMTQDFRKSKDRTKNEADKASVTEFDCLVYESPLLARDSSPFAGDEPGVDSIELPTSRGGTVTGSHDEDLGEAHLKLFQKIINESKKTILSFRSFETSRTTTISRQRSFSSETSAPGRSQVFLQPLSGKLSTQTFLKQGETENHEERKNENV